MVDEVYMGCVIQAGLGQNPARQAAVNAGIPVEVPATTINVLCGSGLHCVNLAAKLIANGEADIIVAGGMENMSKAPYLLYNARFGYRMGAAMMDDALLRDALHDAFGGYHMGITAENIAEDVEKLIDMKEDINGMAGDEIRKMQDMTIKILRLSMEMFNLEDDSHLQEILDLENAIDAKERELQNLHVKCLTAGECTAQVGMMFSDLASNLERVADHATNIAFSILEEDPEGDKPPKVELV